ncbi:DUF3472 domain-containing protein [Solitalea koreensis]|uniref:DUF5077 domain-containing protein n=1 Tax=Solitalea koreensis TaxID=543615 RepID=A0A521CXP1_9SPHI|nr:DUF3472 domain-containing protein [Solitalea koreensis]SMO64194.1 protein of unknown function [Solitalea koreensis]
MTINRKIFFSALLCLAICLTKAHPTFAENKQIIVPLGGNSWIQNGKEIKALMNMHGVTNWKSPNDIIHTYIYFKKPCNVALSFKLKVNQGKSKIKVSALNSAFMIVADNKEFQTLNTGNIEIKEAGYKQIDLQGISKTGDTFAEVSDIILEGLTSDDETAYVKNNNDNYFYWGHRGPSVHLSYMLPEEVKNNIEWFYNEITVPKGKDPIGSYYMANGFKEGYFGIQVNSEKERRILFSVWSPFKTDDPKSIPDSLKIKLLNKGGNVRSGEFGAEGSGGQSYLVYNWQAGTTYKFLTQAKPVDQNNTVYTSYFFDPNQAKWTLIASFKRPSTHTYLKGLHSFLENFDPNNGTITREANYGNQWVCDTTGKWHQITQARFTGDATARKEYRKDYAGGLSNSNSTFYLKNCGFFSNYIPLDQYFTCNQKDGKQPEIDFNSLPTN